MLHNGKPNPYAPPSQHRVKQQTQGKSSDQQESPYGSAFWYTYLANTCLMIVVSLLFRYSDFVFLLGGTESTLGLIVGSGAIGSIMMRLAQGIGIDHYGPRQVWLISSLMIAITLFAHLLLTTVDGPAIYIIRILYHTSLAGAFGASITFISLRAPVVRMAEMVGMLGSSGFVGMAVGSFLGDFLCHTKQPDRGDINILFTVAASFALLSFVSAWLATSRSIAPIKRKRPPVLRLLLRYQPGMMLLMGSVMGFGITLPYTFLRPYTESLGIARMSTFFGTYAATAFVVRFLTRKLPDRIGPRRTVYLGMAALTVGMLLYLSVTNSLSLVFPGFMVGLAHALLFPAVVTGGSISFPKRFRGIGISLMLASFDLGGLLGMPLAGRTLVVAESLHLPAFHVLFLASATLIFVATILFAVVRKKEREQRPLFSAGQSADSPETPQSSEQSASLGDRSSASEEQELINTCSKD